MLSGSLEDGVGLGPGLALVVSFFSSAGLFFLFHAIEIRRFTSTRAPAMNDGSEHFGCCLIWQRESRGSEGESTIVSTTLLIKREWWRGLSLASRRRPPGGTRRVRQPTS